MLDEEKATLQTMTAASGRSILATLQNFSWTRALDGPYLPLSSQDTCSTSSRPSSPGGYRRLSLSTLRLLPRRCTCVQVASILSTILVAVTYILFSTTLHSPTSLPHYIFGGRRSSADGIPITTESVLGPDLSTAENRLAKLNKNYDPASDGGFGKGNVNLTAYRLEMQEAYLNLLGSEEGAVDLLDKTMPDGSTPHVQPVLPQLECHLSLDCHNTSHIPDDLYFTDREVSPPPVSVTAWAALNPSAKPHLFTDDAVESWIARRFPHGAVTSTFHSFPAALSILKFDFFRLLVLLRGGTYSDTDTVPLLPLAKWGRNTIALGPDESLVDEEILRRPPSLMVGLEWVGLEKNERNPLFSRSAGVVQWTFSAAPGHPVILDAIRQIVQNSYDVEELRRQTDAGIKDGTDMLHFDPDSPRAVLEWTGPAILTDAVTRYLRTRWGASISSLAAHTTPVRVGDVLILPLAALNSRSTLFMKILDWALARNGRPLSTAQDCLIHQHAASWWGQSADLKKSQKAQD